MGVVSPFNLNGVKIGRRGKITVMNRAISFDTYIVAILLGSGS